LRVVDVWESQEALNAFIQGQLLPAVQRIGVSFGEQLQPKAVWPVTNILK
jgi:hypothetical protein